MTNHITYDTFGRVLGQTNPAAGDRFLFQGREWDAASGLYFFRARRYDPTTGQFVSEDSAGFTAGDTNLRRFVGNAPNRYTDPTGHFALGEYAVMVSSGFKGAVIGGVLGYLCE